MNRVNILALSRAGFSKIYYGWWLVGAAEVCQFTFLSVGQVVEGMWFGAAGAYQWAFVAVIVPFFAAGALVAASKAPVG